MFPSFLKNKTFKELFEKDIVAEDFNELTLGRALDKIHEYGETKLFSEIATKISLQQIYSRLITPCLQQLLDLYLEKS